MSTWTKDKPTHAHQWGTRKKLHESLGEWWVSIAPEKRTATICEVIKCGVVAIESHCGPHRLYASLGRPMNLVSIDSDLFDGALWKRVDPDPADPFAEQPRDNSRDRDLP
jgi:hypothetical protein